MTKVAIRTQSEGSHSGRVALQPPEEDDNFDPKEWILRQYAEDEAAVREALECSRILFAPCLDLRIIPQFASRIDLFLTTDWTLGQEEICVLLDRISELTPAGSGLQCLERSKLLPHMGIFDDLPWLPDEANPPTVLPTMATLELKNGVVRSQARLLHIPSNPARLYEALFSNRGNAPEALYLHKPDGLSWARWPLFADHRAELGQAVQGARTLPRLLYLDRRLVPWPNFEPVGAPGFRSAATAAFRRVGPRGRL